MKESKWIDIMKNPTVDGFFECPHCGSRLMRKQILKLCKTISDVCPYCGQHNGSSGNRPSPKRGLWEDHK